MAVTILELAKFRGAREDERGITGAEFERVGLAIMGGCEVCEASLAAYNACPSKTGYWRCASGCIGEFGWDDVAEANLAIFGPEESVGPYASTEEVA